MDICILKVLLQLSLASDLEEFRALLVHIVLVIDRTDDLLVFSLLLACYLSVVGFELKLPTRTRLGYNTSG